MKDKKINEYMRIGNAIKSAVFSLHMNNDKYGTGFDLWRTGNSQITLELMDDCAKYGSVIDSIVIDFNINVSEVTEMSDNGWVSHVVSLLENSLFGKQSVALMGDSTDSGKLIGYSRPYLRTLSKMELIKISESSSLYKACTIGRAKHILTGLHR